MVCKDDLLRSLLERNVNINMYLAGKNIMYNVNTGTKSQLEFWFEENSIKCFMRYDEKSTISLEQELDDVLQDLAYTVKSCMHGRPYIDRAWENILVEFSLISVETVEERKVIFK